MQLLRLATITLLAGLPGTAPAPTDPVAAVAADSLEQADARLDALVLNAIGRPEERPAGDPFIGRSRFYEVHSTRSPRIAARVARQLDGLFATYQSFFATDFVPDEPFKIVLYPDNASYRDLGDDFDERSSVTGSFYVAEGSNDFVAVDHSDPDNDSLLGIYLAYGATHQFVAKAFPGRRLPPLLDEGLAAYFCLAWNDTVRSYMFERFEVQRKDEDTAHPWIPLQVLVQRNLSAVTDAGRGNDLLYQLAYTIAFLREHFGEDRESAEASFDAYLAGVMSGKVNRRHELHRLLTKNVAELDALTKGYNGWLK